MAESKLRELSTDFAVKVIKMRKTVLHDRGVIRRMLSDSINTVFLKILKHSSMM